MDERIKGKGDRRGGGREGILPLPQLLYIKKETRSMKGERARNLRS